MPSLKIPSAAMILAAGLGVRLRPLTLERPKPLLEVGGRTFLDRVLDSLAEVGVEVAVINTFYKGEMIAAHVAARVYPHVLLSPEKALLETGGGVKQALSLLGSDPFFVLNADMLWRDGSVPALKRLAQAWDSNRMDALLLLVPVEKAVGLNRDGDYHLESENRLRRRQADEKPPYFYAGMQLIHPRAFEGTPDKPFSNNLIWDRLQTAGRLHGLVHDGDWYHADDPAALAHVQSLWPKA